MDFLWIFYLVMIVVFLGRKLYILFVCDLFERDERGKKEMYACFVRVEWNEKESMCG